MADRSEEEWQAFIAQNISEVLAPETDSGRNAAPLSSIATPSDSRFPLAIDHTLLKQEATPAQIDVLCDEAIAYGFKVGI